MGTTTITREYRKGLSLRPLVTRTDQIPGTAFANLAENTEHTLLSGIVLDPTTRALVLATNHVTASTIQPKFGGVSFTQIGSYQTDPTVGNKLAAWALPLPSLSSSDLTVAVPAGASCTIVFGALGVKGQSSDFATAFKTGAGYFTSSFDDTSTVSGRSMDMSTENGGLAVGIFWAFVPTSLTIASPQEICKIPDQPTMRSSIFYGQQGATTTLQGACSSNTFVGQLGFTVHAR
jgi:hypothetical protein